MLPGDGHAEILPGPGADVIDGGGGNDHVSFAYATGPVHADLATPGAVDPTGEGDAMTGVESVEGGSGDDVLLGADGDSLLVGGDGDDRLDGRGGRDVIVGGRGADTISGGAGDDDLASGSGQIVVPDRRYYTGHTDERDTDVVTGGAGADLLRVGTGDRGDAGAGRDMVFAAGRPARLRCGSGERDRFDGLRVPRDCERVLVFGADMPTRVRLRGATLTVPVTGAGPVRVVVTVDGRVVARRRTRTRRADRDRCACGSRAATSAYCAERARCA